MLLGYRDWSSSPGANVNVTEFRENARVNAITCKSITGNFVSIAQA